MNDDGENLEVKGHTEMHQYSEGCYQNCIFTGEGNAVQSLLSSGIGGGVDTGFLPAYFLHDCVTYAYNLAKHPRRAKNCVRASVYIFLMYTSNFYKERYFLFGFNFETHNSAL